MLFSDCCSDFPQVKWKECNQALLQYSYSWSAVLDVSVHSIIMCIPLVSLLLFLKPHKGTNSKINSVFLDLCECILGPFVQPLIILRTQLHYMSDVSPQIQQDYDYIHSQSWGIPITSPQRLLCMWNLCSGISTAPQWASSCVLVFEYFFPMLWKKGFTSINTHQKTILTIIVIANT